MTVEMDNMNAEVISVFPNKLKISVDKLEDFTIPDQSLKVGSYLSVADQDNAVMIAIIENFSIEVDSTGNRKYLIEAIPLGIIKNGEFTRGGDSLAIPPKNVKPATEEQIKEIFENSVCINEKFVFSKLSSNQNIALPVNGNKFFNKHIAIVGSTGSGKSYSLSTIIQKAVAGKNGEFSLNNSHIIIFDIHSEYKTAFPDANYIDIGNLQLPYWLLNSDELEEILLDTGERDNYNQSSVFRKLVTLNKKKHNPDLAKLFYDTPVFFDIGEISNALENLKNETVNSKSSDKYMLIDEENPYSYEAGESTTPDTGITLTQEERINKYFEKVYKFHPTKQQNIKNGDYAEGSLDRFVVRFQSKINEKRLEFLFSNDVRAKSFEDVLKKLMGYIDESCTNVTIIDLSGIPFEVLSISVSLISRMLFEYGYYYKRLRCEKNPNEQINNDIPLLLVFEEAHKYVPNSDLTRYRSSRNSIERIAKEGRKYGVTLLLASQRPSEISETIFSQCSNFIVMRLTNPNDQNYIKKLIPDTLGGLIDKLPSLKAGEALLIGESVILPSIVQIDLCEKTPSSNDIPYWSLWKDQWRSLDFDKLKIEWFK